MVLHPHRILLSPLNLQLSMSLYLLSDVILEVAILDMHRYLKLPAEGKSGEGKKKPEVEDKRANYLVISLISLLRGMLRNSFQNQI